jgi:hypothetical protein
MKSIKQLINSMRHLFSYPYNSHSSSSYGAGRKFDLVLFLNKAFQFRGNQSPYDRIIKNSLNDVYKKYTHNSVRYF